jgi:uncharacterized protein (DUF302 family)
MFAGPVVVRRRPLLRAAAIGGTYAAGREVGRRVQERQYEQAAQDARISAIEDRQADGTVLSVTSDATAPPAGPADAPVLDQLARLTVLHDQGALTDEEFAAAKAKVLGNLSQNARRATPMTQSSRTIEHEIVTKPSPRSVPDTVARLTNLITAKGMKLFASIDQSAEARGAGLNLRDTTLVMFGSPAAGTPVMQASPLSALDLPLKVLIWDDGGQTKVTYFAPSTLAHRYGLDAELAARLAGIDALTDALVAPS